MNWERKAWNVLYLWLFIFLSQLLQQQFIFFTYMTCKSYCFRICQKNRKWNLFWITTFLKIELYRKIHTECKWLLWVFHTSNGMATPAFNHLSYFIRDSSLVRMSLATCSLVNFSATKEKLNITKISLICCKQEIKQKWNSSFQVGTDHIITGFKW